MNPALPTYGSTITAAISSPRRRNTPAAASASLNGTVRVSCASAAGTPGLSGSPRVATPLPALTRKLSPWP